MNKNAGNGRRRWNYALGLAGVACLCAALLCGVGSLAVGQGRVAPSLNLRIGGVGIVAGVARAPECPPHCEGQRPSSGQQIYSVWFVSTRADSAGEHTSARLLFARPLR